MNRKRVFFPTCIPYILRRTKSIYKVFEKKLKILFFVNETATYVDELRCRPANTSVGLVIRWECARIYVL